MITPSPCFMSALRGTSSGLAQNKKGMPNTPPTETGIPSGASGVAYATPRRRCALRERKCSDISAKIVCIRNSYRQFWQFPIIPEAG